MDNEIKVATLDLFPVLDRKLIELLRSLTPAEWESPTVAKWWKVKDVAAHLLDGNLRALSSSRDQYFGEKPENINSYQDLVDFLNHLNMSWTKATQRLSPQVLISLLEFSGKEYVEHLQSLHPFDRAIFSVAWAGEEHSPNWFHIAREYTERFLHQQQIRDAVNKPGILTKELYYPFMDTFMFAFPHTFRHISAENGTIVSLKVSTEIGGIWNIIKTPTAWVLDKNTELKAHAQVVMDPHTAWKLFSKSWKPEQVMDQVKIVGDPTLARQVLNIVAVMA